ncbi:ABC transporter permease [Liquorilactobacillus capillatus]|uniref:Membrane protein n=1 Tax=Liquorilactobacillus capillatus DSM 19910 TaxID=1423731 RepID=A0A0R1LXZ6_9LACO|nr:ABC transporter permease [Liquorilactobacillus capillatus]KRL00508.1 membrane protein [Liquorilactobacillus capillatus DSM 19910]
MKYLESEFYKNKRRNFWMAIAGLFLFSLVWGGITTNVQLIRRPTQILETTIFNMLTINNLIFPFLIALLTVRLVQPEHDNKMFQVLILNGEQPWTLFLAKLTANMLVLLGGILLQTLMIIVFIILKGAALTPWSRLLLFLVPLMISGLVISVIQLGLAFYFKKPTIPLCLGLAGSFLSLITSGFLPKWITIFIPWQYVSVLNPLSIGATGLQYSNIWLFYLALVMLIGLLLILIIRNKMKNKKKVVL